MEDSALRVIRVLSNNAVVAQGATREHVLAGRGIGFGHRAGDLIDPKTGLPDKLCVYWWRVVLF